MPSPLAAKGAPFKARNTIGAVTFSVGAEVGGNAITVSVQLKDSNYVDLAVRASLFGYLSNDANGDSLITTAPSGGVAIGTDGLAIPLVAGKAWQFTSEADGDIDITLTEASTLTCYLILVLPDGSVWASGAITFV